VVDRAGGVASRREHPGVPGARGRRSTTELRDVARDLQVVRVAADVRDGSVAAIAQGRVRVLPSELVEFAIWAQDLLQLWVLGCLFVGVVLLLLGGAPAAGAALVGSSVLSFVAFLTSRLYGGDHLETLVHGAVILGSVGLVGFGLAGLALGSHAPLGRYPMALVPAIGTVLVGTRLVLGIHAGAPLPCSPRLCYRGFEEPWVQGLLAFNVVFLAALFLVPAWRASRSSGKEEEDDPFVDWVV
jgi:hypothetical protein